jgi:hypothetical protein
MMWLFPSFVEVRSILQLEAMNQSCKSSCLAQVFHAATRSPAPSLPPLPALAPAPPPDVARCWWCKAPSSWEPQEEGMMSTAARFSLSKKPRFINPKGKKPNDWRWCLLACDSSRQFIRRLVQCFALPAATRNMQTHNQILCSQLTIRLSISPVCCKQRNDRIEWKAVIVCE